MEEPDEQTFATLEAEIERLRNTAGLLHHRLDSMQRLLDQETFQLEAQPLKPHKLHAERTRELLVAMGVSEEGLTMGAFLRALNRYLIQNDLVDLNDLQIHLSPLLMKVFHKAPGLKKVPYALLLLSLPCMFQ